MTDITSSEVICRKKCGEKFASKDNENNLTELRTTYEELNKRKKEASNLCIERSQLIPLYDGCYDTFGSLVKKGLDKLSQEIKDLKTDSNINESKISNIALKKDYDKNSAAENKHFNDKHVAHLDLKEEQTNNG